MVVILGLHCSIWGWCCFSCLSVVLTFSELKHLERERERERLLTPSRYVLGKMWRI